MTGKVHWLRLMVGGACCALAVAAGEAATTVRTIQSGGSTQLRSVAPGADGEALRWFAIAQAPEPIGLISRRGEWYYIRSKQARRADGGELKLDQGRIKAYEKFEKNRELVKEVEENVDAATRAHGEAKVGLILQEHIKQLVAQVSTPSVPDAIKEQVEREVEEIEAYLKRMTTIR